MEILKKFSHYCYLLNALIMIYFLFPSRAVSINVSCKRYFYTSIKTFIAGTINGEINAIELSKFNYRTTLKILLLSCIVFARPTLNGNSQRTANAKRTEGIFETWEEKLKENTNHLYRTFSQRNVSRSFLFLLRFMLLTSTNANSLC